MPWRGLALALLLIAGSAAAATELRPGYDDRAPRGPATARGVVIWNHGLGADFEASGPSPYLMDELWDAGYDVARLWRDRAGDRLEGAATALIDTGRQLRARGYREVIAAGQSFGGWIAFAATGRSSGVFDVVLALAPAAHGQVGRSRDYELNADNLYALAEALLPTRVLAAFFADDRFDPGGRGPRLARILEAKRIPYSVIDRPPGFAGHGAGQSLGFARAYGPCIVAFVTAAAASNPSACAAPVVEPRAADFPALPSVEIADPATVSAPLRSFLGNWFGWLDNGRQVQLVIAGGTPDRVTGLYAWTAASRGERNGYDRMSGALGPDGVLLFAESGKRRIAVAPQPDGRLQLLWTRADGGNGLTATLRRLGDHSRS